MSKRTQTKLSRTMVYKDTNKVAYIAPPAQKTPKVISYEGKEMLVLVSEGQIINPKKEYKRRMKELAKRKK